MRNRIAEPEEVTEVLGGRFDGMKRVESECPGCGGKVVHLLGWADFGPSPRMADCTGPECRGTAYEVVRPKPGILPGVGRRWWDLTPSSFDALGLVGSQWRVS